MSSYPGFWDAQGRFRPGSCSASGRLVEHLSRGQPDQRVLLFDKRCHVTGKNYVVRLDAGDYNLSEFGLENRLVKMEMPPRRWVVTLYTEQNQKGSASPAFSQTTCFQNMTWPKGMEAFTGMTQPPRPKTPLPEPWGKRAKSIRIVPFGNQDPRFD
jgi:hypothetical protein